MSHVTRTGAHMISPQTAFIIDTDLHDTQVCVCCSVVQCGAVWCSVVQCGAVWCSVVQCGAVWCNVVQCGAVCCSVLQCVFCHRQRLTWYAGMCVRVCCTVLQYVVVCCSVSFSSTLIDTMFTNSLYIHVRVCVAEWWSVLQCGAVYVPVVVCCSVLWCDGVCYRHMI